MKKLIASLAVAFLMAAGLVAGASTTASAGPYSGTVSTIIDAQTPNIRRNQNARVRINLRAAQGNGTPRGQVSVTFVRQGSGEVAKVFTRYYNGSPNTYKFRTKGLRPGKYLVIVTYIGNSRSVYRGSSVVSRFVVRR